MFRNWIFISYRNLLKKSNICLMPFKKVKKAITMKSRKNLLFSNILGCRDKSFYKQIKYFFSKTSILFEAMIVYCSKNHHAVPIYIINQG